MRARALDLIPMHGTRAEEVPRSERADASSAQQAEPGWLADLITRQVPLDQSEDAYARRPDDIKAVLTFANA